MKYNCLVGQGNEYNTNLYVGDLDPRVTVRSYINYFIYVVVVVYHVTIEAIGHVEEILAFWY